MPPFKLNHAPDANKRILPSGDDLLNVMLVTSLSKDDPFFHAQQDRHLVGFSTPSLFAPGEHLIRGCRVYAMLPGERLN